MFKPFNKYYWTKAEESRITIYNILLIYQKNGSIIDAVYKNTK